jgi:N-formylmaleamate deformylase
MHTIPTLMVAVALASCATGATTAPLHTTAPSTPPAAASFRVEVTGKGPPMILIPGLASSGETWATTVEHLRDRYTCHVLTLAGFAGVPPIGAALLPAAKSDLARYVTAQRLVEPVIIGHSLGGELALDFAAEHPELVGPLVIVDSLPFLGAITGAKTVEDTRPWLEQMRSGMTNQHGAQREASLRASTREMVTSAADHERIVSWGLASDRATVADAFVELFATDLRPRLARITVPVLVIGTWIGYRDRPGGADRASFVQSFRDQYAALPRLHFVLSETARHFVMFDDLPWFTAQLDRFLADPDAAVRDRGFTAE